MRLPGWVFTTMIVLELACSGAEARHSSDGAAMETGGEGTMTLDLSSYLSGHVPAALRVSNETLAFPLVLGAPSVRTLSQDAPGDLQVVYTRVGCWVDPEAWLGSTGTVPVTLPAIPPVSVTTITIDHLYSPDIAGSLAELADHTCVSVRAPDGVWGPFLRPDNVAITPDKFAQTHFSADGRTGDAVAIFLPIYTYVSQITYAARPVD